MFKHQLPLLTPRARECVKVPGSEDGRAPMAALVCDAPPDMDALLKHIQFSLANYAVPQASSE